MRVRLAKRLRAWLGRDKPWRWAAPLGVLVGLPTLGLGLQADDYLLRANLLREPGLTPLHSAPWDVFHFYPTLDFTELVERGLGPWWSNPEMEARFFRPLTSLTHFVDFLAWSSHPWVMHLESILLYGVSCGLVAALYRRLLGGWAAGLAALLYVLDHAHGVPVAWIANRNALVAAAFGFAALLFHHRARRGGRARDRVLAPLLLFAALAGGEMALGAVAYLGAYALCLERGSLALRLRTLLPYAPVGLLWATLYGLGGYGVHGSGLYLDPLREPWPFLRALPVHATLALAAELGLPPPDLWLVLPAGGQAVLGVWALGVLALASVALLPLLRRDAVARFFGLGALLAVVPVTATFPSSRLTLVCGFGLLGLAARAFVGWRDGEAWVPRPGFGKRALVVFAYFVVGVRLALAPATVLAAEFQLVPVSRLISRLDRSMPDEPAIAAERVVVVSAPDSLLPMYVFATRAARRAPLPAGFFLVGLATHELSVERTGQRTMVVRDPAGFYGDGFSTLVRPPALPMRAGTELALGAAALEVLEVRAGVPTAIELTFDVSLEDDSLRFVAWNGHTLVPWAPPSVGERRALEAHPNPMLTVWGGS